MDFAYEGPQMFTCVSCDDCASQQCQGQVLTFLTCASLCNAGNAVAMTLGLPAMTLRRMGITKAISDDFVLPIKITGVSSSPDVDIVRYIHGLSHGFRSQAYICMHVWASASALVCVYAGV